MFNCIECSLLFVHPAPAQEIIDELYENHSYHDRDRYQVKQLDEAKKRIWKQRLRRIMQFRKSPGSLLDVGCATGIFMKVAEEENWQVAGVETSEKAAVEARELVPSAFIKTGFLPDIKFDQKYELVSLWAVIEHFSDPKPFIKFISEELLERDGLLVLSTPSIDSLAQKISRKSWRYYVPPFHLLYFRKKSLRILLETYGFQILSWHSHFRHIAFFKQGSTLEKLYQSNAVFRFVMKIVLWPLKFYSDRYHLGDTLEVIAQKK
jgi:2-polyprenyl-3-methyl-5-hydroxy-6-metoxy-1,4-benzoquinol methylase